MEAQNVRLNEWNVFTRNPDPRTKFGRSVVHVLFFVLAVLLVLVFVAYMARAEVVVTTVTKPVVLTVNDVSVLLSENNVVVLNLSKNQNVSVVHNVVGTNVTSFNTTVLTTSVFNSTTIINSSCNIDLNVTKELLQNLTIISTNNTVNTTFVRDIFNRKIEELTEYFNTNHKPLSDKLLECSRELNDEKLAKGNCFFNQSNHNVILEAERTKTHFWTQLSYIFMGLSLFTTFIVIIQIMMTSDNILLNKILKRRKPENET